MRWCLSSGGFSVLINGTPTGFFVSSRGLRQGDPLPHFLFILAMEVLSSILKKAMERGFIQGFLASGRGGEGKVVSHLVFANGTLISNDSNKEHLEALSWVFMWFKVIYGLKINLDKSELILVGKVSNKEDLAMVVGCKVGSLPSTYLGLPLDASFKSVQAWDVMEERFQKTCSMKETILVKRREIDFFFFLISKPRYIDKGAKSYKYTGGIQSNKPLKKPKKQQASPSLSWTPTILGIL